MKVSFAQEVNVSISDADGRWNAFSSRVDNTEGEKMVLQGLYIAVFYEAASLKRGHLCLRS